MSKGYHLSDIPKGELGEVSKILEEVLELQDANSQDVRIMELVELSDVVGAIQAFLRKHYPDITLTDLSEMAEVTRRAFEAGER